MVLAFFYIYTMRKLVSAAFIIILLFGCNEDRNESISRASTSYIKIEGLAQGTTYHITYSDQLERNFQQSVDSILKVIDNSMSTYIDSSIISRCNNGWSNCQLDEHMLYVFCKSSEIYQLTEGDFDPTVKPLIDFWGFGSSGEGNQDLIDSSKVDSILNFVGMNYIKLYSQSEDKIVQPIFDSIFGPASGYKLVKNKLTQLDFNAIAQGYTVDVISEFLVSKKVMNYLVEVGGEVRVLGNNSRGQNWSVGIDKPVNESSGGRPLQAILSLDNKSIATSGNYRKFRMKNGVKYSHTISAKSGYPVQHNILGATVVADDCITADAFATAFMVMGHEKAIQFLESHPEMLQGYLIYSGNNGKLNTYYSPELEGKIKEKKN